MGSFKASQALSLPVDKYLILLANEKNLAKSSLLNYQSDLTSFLSFMSDYRLSDWSELKKKHVLAFFNDAQNSGKAVASLKRQLSCTRGFILFLNSKNLLLENNLLSFQFEFKEVIAHQVRPKIDIERLLGFTVNNFIAMRDKAILMLVVHTSLKLKEISLLDFYSLDFKAEQLIVTKKATVGKVVKLNTETVHVLECWFEQRQSLPLANDHLFVSLSEKPLSVRALQLRLAYWGEKIGVKKLSLQVLRRSIISSKNERASKCNYSDLRRACNNNASEVEKTKPKKKTSAQLRSQSTLMNLYSNTHPRAK